MRENMRALLEKRNRIVATSRAILEAAEKEGRGMTSEEQANFNTAMTDIDNIRITIESEERLAQIEAANAAAAGQSAQDAPENRDGARADGQGRAARTVGHGRYTVNLDEQSAEHRSLFERRSTPAYRAAMAAYMRTGEARALDAGGGGGPGNGQLLVMPLQMSTGILQALDDNVFMRNRATVFSLPTATSLGRVSLDNDADDFEWLGELSEPDEDTGMEFGRRELTPHPMAKLLKISNKLLRQSTINIEETSKARIGYRAGLTEEKAFLLGNGQQKPLGVFVPSVDGVPTSRDVATGNAATSLKFDGIIAAKYALKSGYLKNAAWMWSRTAMAQIATLRDETGGAGTGQYLWQPSTQMGQPDMILGIPSMVSEFVPATFTSGQYVGMLADWSYYHIADALDMQLQRLNEKFALSNQTGFIFRKETDGMPVLAEAFVRVKLG
jgi:HK97 family phage major capsid protein